jgi:glycosyltransferase involved in cell wall biosynthesis
MAKPMAGKASVAILLATYNGSELLAPQLDSFLTQTHRDWTLVWRDDGSCDASRAIVDRFGAGLGRGRLHVVDEPTIRLGIAGSYLQLLRSAPATAAFAFADQDDIWLPDKLERGVAALATTADDVPAIYCSRQVLVDSCLDVLANSARLRYPPQFPAALTQNIATGCTVMLNRPARDLVAASAPPPQTLHDWWTYLVVTAADGVVHFDPLPTVLYRQHPSNAIGASTSLGRRAVAALRRGPAPFMAILRGNIDALLAQPRLTTTRSREQLTQIHNALAGGPSERLRALCLTGFRRQTLAETGVFALWFMLG